jgi:hypothetical protein
VGRTEGLGQGIEARVIHADTPLVVRNRAN